MFFLLLVFVYLCLLYLFVLKHDVALWTGFYFHRNLHNKVGGFWILYVRKFLNYIIFNLLFNKHLFLISE